MAPGRLAGSLLAVLAALASQGAVASSFPDAPGPVAKPRCDFGVSAIGIRQKARISTRCNFAQIRVRVRAEHRLFGLEGPYTHGPHDPGDDFSCRKLGDGTAFAAGCSGRVGADVRVSTNLVSHSSVCGQSLTVKVVGTADCSPGTACPELAYVVKRAFESPSGCGAG